MTDQEIPAVNTEIKVKSKIVSADRKVTKDGRKVPAKVIREASYKGNIGIMELIKFKTNASPEQKKAFDLLMKKKSEAKSEQQEKQMAGQIWDLVQTVTGVRLQQMENKFIPFKSILESSDDHILHSLAQRDINASIKDGKVVIYDKADHKKAQGVVKRLGVPHQVVVQKNEDVENLDELSNSTLSSYRSKALAAQQKKIDNGDGKSRAPGLRTSDRKIRANDAETEKEVQGYTNNKFKGRYNESVKVGDSVHVGMSQKGGAGVRGVVTKIDGDWVHVRSHDKEKSAFTGKEIHKSYKGQLKHTTKD